MVYLLAVTFKIHFTQLVYITRQQCYGYTVVELQHCNEYENEIINTNAMMQYNGCYLVATCIYNRLCATTLRDYKNELWCVQMKLSKQYCPLKNAQEMFVTFLHIIILRFTDDSRDEVVCGPTSTPIYRDSYETTKTSLHAS